MIMNSRYEARTLRGLVYLNKRDAPKFILLARVCVRDRIFLCWPKVLPTDLSQSQIKRYFSLSHAADLELPDGLRSKLVFHRQRKFFYSCGKNYDSFERSWINVLSTAKPSELLDRKDSQSTLSLEQQSNYHNTTRAARKLPRKNEFNDTRARSNHVDDAITGRSTHTR